VGIVAFCPQGHRVKVKDHLAGRKGVCPTCGSRFRIPLTSVSEPVVTLPLAAVLTLEAAVIATLPRVLPAEAKPGRSDAPHHKGAGGLPPTTVPRHAALDERPDLAWSRATPGGTAAAPMSAADLRVWLDSGMAVGTELVWRADWDGWRPLGDVFPEAKTAVGRS
jgi:hypothetical protein